MDIISLYSSFMKIFITKISNTKVMHSCRYLEKRLLIRRIGILAILVSPCILDFKSNWPMVMFVDLV
ncbi:hypothetical protein T4B_1208 [Trichinella pseudospiralis]|uniref:Uncharacterized protein n=1 Tax=Trichinella pseudospiralis TaxID=6337 RepID=A0A0V1IKU2_TRIPS|nr:hypothetical protein T4A_11293 [Trichinella pseudospiralis]KRZ23395.1 hypothetical protein T4B_1208 [Trichinella pseudospiralis]KRZ40748.1 hypothetical protein T4C_13741 [Trichinella pseudospiralis]